MNILNEKVQHISFGAGIITEVKDQKIWVEFQKEIGTKVFLYPDIFEKFLKAENQTLMSSILEELLVRKHEKIELERIEKEREAAELVEKEEKLRVSKKKSTLKPTKKKF